MTMGRFVFKGFCVENVSALKKCLPMWAMEMAVMRYIVEILEIKQREKQDRERAPDTDTVDDMET